RLWGGGRGGEGGGGMEGGEREAVGGAVAGDQRGRLAIADQRVILDTGRHEDLWPEIDDDLDLAFAVLERLAPAFDRDVARDQPAEPILVRARERGRRHLVCRLLLEKKNQYDVVVKHYCTVSAADIVVHMLY